MKSGPNIFAYCDSESNGATEFRRLARKVRLSANPSEIRSILVTSAMMGEGKSLVAANLAIAIARREKDRKVLILDFDLRRPMLHTLFGVRRLPGLERLLSGSIDLDELIHDTELENLKILQMQYYSYLLMLPVILLAKLLA